jgi:hypothetical protein
MKLLEERIEQKYHNIRFGNVYYDIKSTGKKRNKIENNTLHEEKCKWYIKGQYQKSEDTHDGREYLKIIHGTRLSMVH